MARDYDHLFKILLIGDSGVGKSELVLRFVDSNFSGTYKTTVGVDFKIRAIDVNGEKVKLQIWDTTGQERFRTITSTYYRGTHGIIIVYDVTNGESFVNVKRWLQEIDQNCNVVDRILVGNRNNCLEKKVVQTEDARKFADQIGIQLYEVSAKENINVKEVFHALAQLVLQTKRESMTESGTRAGSRGQRPVTPPKRSKNLDMTTHSKPVRNEAGIQLPSDIPIVHMLARNRGEHQPKLQLEKHIMLMYPNPLSPPNSTRKFYPMNSQKHGVALIINNKKLSEGSTLEMGDCDELNLTETLMFLGYHVWIYKACSHDAMKNLFEQIDRLDPVIKSGGIDSFICCILSRGDEKMVYGSDNKPVELRMIQEKVNNSKLFKKLPKLFFIQVYLGKQVDPANHLILSKHSDFYFSCAVTSSELPFRDPNKGSSYITELCKALCTHSTDMVLSDILINVGIILKAKHNSHSQLLKEDNQLKKEVYFFHGADASSLNSIGHHLSGRELLALPDILQEHVIESLKKIGLDLKAIGGTQTTIEEVQSLLHSIEQHEVASSLSQRLDSALENQSHYEAYQQALKEGIAISLKYLKVLFFGPPRTGKTSMRRRLVGEIQNLSNEPVQASTGTAEAYDVIVKLVEDKLTTSTTVITKSKWSTVKALLGKGQCPHETDLDEELQILYQIINGVVLTIKKRSLPDPVEEKETKDKVAKQQHSARVKKVNILSPILRLVKSSKAVKINPEPSILQEDSPVREPTYGLSTKEFEEIEKAFAAFRKVLHTPGQGELKLLLDGTILMNMVDTGGQPAFLEMLPALTVGPALYLIFFRLNQNLKQRYQIQYVSEDNENVQLDDSSYTVEEVIFQALSSIACFSCTAPKKADMPNPSHAAMLIGTHRDLLGSDPETEIKAKDGELRESLRDILETESFLRYSSHDQLMFAINNMTGDEKELTEVRQRLEDVIKQEFDDFPIPASWLMFNIFLRKMGNRILSLLQCREIGDRLEVKNTDEVLWFLHHCVGTLMHFPDIEELKDIVICDPQVVFDSVTDLILNSFKLERVNKTACDKFKETGQFCFKDIQKIAKNSKCDSLPLPKLVKLLEYLNIIALITPEGPSCSGSSTASSLPLSPRISQQSDVYQEEKLVYFMPAVLKKAREEELHMELNPTAPVPLMVHFKCGFVPVGVFCAAIASLVAQRDTLGWILQEPSKHKSSHILSKNNATFRIDGLYDVTLISKPRRYEIHLACISTADRTALTEICCLVLKTVCDTLDQVISKMRYKQYLMASPSDQTLYELGFKCAKHPDEDHLIINRPRRATGASSQSAKSLWLSYYEGNSVMICLEEQRSIDITESSLPPQQSLVWFGKEVTKMSPVVPDSILDDPRLPKITISHLQLIRYCHRTSNKQALRLLQCLAPKWKKVGEILGLHRAVIQTIENPGSGRDPEDCIRRVFVKWLDNAPGLPNYHQYPFTWRGLHNLLIDSDNGEAAVELKIALSSPFNTVQGTFEAANTAAGYTDQLHPTVAEGISHLKLSDTLQATERSLQHATHSQGQTSQPHSTNITGGATTPEMPPVFNQKNTAAGYTDQLHPTVAEGISHLKLSDTLQATERSLQHATHSQGQISQPHSTNITGGATTPEMPPVFNQNNTAAGYTDQLHPTVADGISHFKLPVTLQAIERSPQHATQSQRQTSQPLSTNNTGGPTTPEIPPVFKQKGNSTDVTSQRSVQTDWPCATSTQELQPSETLSVVARKQNAAAGYTDHLHSTVAEGIPHLKLSDTLQAAETSSQNATQSNRQTSQLHSTNISGGATTPETPPISNQKCTSTDITSQMTVLHEETDWPRATSTAEVTELRPSETQPSETFPVVARKQTTQLQGQTSRPHFTTITGGATTSTTGSATPEMPPIFKQKSTSTDVTSQMTAVHEQTEWPCATSTAAVTELQSSETQTSETLPVVARKQTTQSQGQASQSHFTTTTAGATTSTRGNVTPEIPPIFKQKSTFTDITSQMTALHAETDWPYATSTAEVTELQSSETQPSETLPVVTRKQIGNIHPRFRQSMSFEEFTDLLKQRGVMGKDIDLLTRESINAKAFVMLGEEELKELGVSFGGRMILRKLIEELK